MDIKEFAVKLITRFFMLVTFISAAEMILGKLLDPSARFGYEAFLSPMIYALCGVIPGAVMYSKRELSVRQTMFRKAVQLVIIEAEVLAIIAAGYNPETSLAGVLLAVGAAVLVIFIAVNVVEYLFDMSTAQKLNSCLDRLHTENMK